jgi:hypothetical protein
MLPDGETIFCFIFDDLTQFKNWWLVVCDGEVDLCTESPGKDVDLYISTTLRNLVQVWEGDIDIKLAQRKKLLKTHGNSQLARTMPDWLGICLYADIRPGDPALMKVAAGD